MIFTRIALSTLFVVWDRPHWVDSEKVGHACPRSAMDLSIERSDSNLTNSEYIGWLGTAQGL
jgi:hypothetical protein